MNKTIKIATIALALVGLAACGGKKDDKKAATTTKNPRVRLECNPEIPVAPGEEHCLLDTSLDEVYWPCSHSRAIPSFPSQLEWKIGLAWANTRGSLNSPS